jgi:nucleotide-binding universal stress UspA family protein
MNKILVPTDFTPLARNAVKYAVEFAKTIKSEVIIFHSDEQDSSDVKRLQAEVNKSIEKSPGVKITFHSSHRHFSSVTVNEVVKSLHISMIIMGTHGEKISVEKRLFGRESSEITEHAKCPVIVVPQGYKYSPIKNIAYASDLNFIDKEIAGVIHFARSFHAIVRMFHVTPVFPELGKADTIDMDKKTEEIKDKFTFSDIHYNLVEMENDNEIAEGISKFISDHKTDLLILFHNHMSVIDEFLATSNTAEVISEIKVPVMIYPKV